MAEAILRVTQRAGVGLVINDHPSLAVELGAEFCHLGQDDFFGAGYTQVSQIPAAMKSQDARVGCKQPPTPQVRIGLSSAAPEQARRAEAAGAEYLGVGPVY